MVVTGAAPKEKQIFCSFGVLENGRVCMIVPDEKLQVKIDTVGFCYLGVLEDEGIGMIVPDEELEVKIDGLLPGENIAQLLNPILKLLLLCNTINQINLHVFESGYGS